MNVFIRKNYLRILVLAVLAGLFAAAARGMESGDFVITLLRGLSVGSLTFLVASGFSLIFGLLDVLNLAHGTLFMIGAYIGWTVYVRPDTFVDLLTPIALVLSGFLLRDVWTALSTRNLFPSRMKRILPWVGLLVSALLLFSILTRYPISFWSQDNYAESPVSIAYNAGQGINVIPPPAVFEIYFTIVCFHRVDRGKFVIVFQPVVVWRVEAHRIAHHMAELYWVWRCRSRGHIVFCFQ